MDDDEIRGKFWEMRAKADYKAQQQSVEQKFEAFRRRAAQEVKATRMDNAVSRALVDNKDRHLFYKAPLISEQQAKNRPGEKVLLEKTRGMKQSESDRKFGKLKQQAAEQRKSALVDRAIAGAVVDHLAQQTGKKASLIPEHQRHKRPGPKLVLGKTKGMKRKAAVHKHRDRDGGRSM